MKKMVMIVMLVMLVCMPVFAVVASGKTQENFTDLAASYATATDDGKKVEILTKLISADCVESHDAFYETLRKAHVSDMPNFTAALKKAGSVNLLINLGPYIEKLQAPFRQEARKNPNMDLSEKLDLQTRANKILTPIQVRIELLGEDLGAIGRKDPDALAKKVVETFSTEKSDAYLAGPMLGLFAMKEEGATVLLKALGDIESAKGGLGLVAHAFGPYAVIPACKQVETATTEKSRQAASVVILMLPDVPMVYDKVIEAYKHGRYSEEKKDKDGKVVISSLAAALDMANRWWGNYFRHKYADNEKFVAYVAKKYLDDKDSQDKVIELIAGVNFGAAAPYFAKLDFANLPNESLKALLQGLYISPTIAGSRLPSVDKKNFEAEKFVIFCQVFDGLDAKVRKEHQLIYKLSSFSPVHRELFVKSSVGSLTDDEKITVAVSCASDSLLTERLPRETQTSILAILRQNSTSEKVLGMVNHIEKKIKKNEM